MAGRSRPDRCRDPIDWPSTPSSCGSRKSSATRRFTLAKASFAPEIRGSIVKLPTALYAYLQLRSTRRAHQPSREASMKKLGLLALALLGVAPAAVAAENPPVIPFDT